MSGTEKRFDNVDGVPMHYARQPVAAYGTIGRQRHFRSSRAFYLKLSNCFTELWRVCRHGSPQAIVSAGAYVNKPGRHGIGHALDIDAIFWPGKTFITNRFPEYPEYYLGVEAILRKHFGIVLAYNYNRAHRDHFHIDDGRRPGFGRARSHTLFLQGVCWYILGKRFRGGVDGDFGNATRTVLDEACAELGAPTPLSNRDNYNLLLDIVARRGIGVSAAGGLPADRDCVSGIGGRSSW